MRVGKNPARVRNERTTRMTPRRRFSTITRIVPAIVLTLHAIAHSPGVLGAWKIAEFEDASFQPNVLLTDASDTMVAFLGAFWLIAAVAYLVAATALFRNVRWWPTATFLAVLMSLGMTILWMDDAIAGLVINIAVLTALFLLNVWTLWHDLDEGRMRPGTPSHA